MTEYGSQPALPTPIVPPRLDTRAASRRSLEERVVVRYPGLYRATLNVALRIPPSRLRRRMVAYWVQRAYAAANRRDFELLLVGIDPDHAYRPSPEITPPDLAGGTRGQDGYVRMWRHWLDAFEDIRYEPVEVLDFGDRFLVTVRQVGHGSGSGIGLARPVYQLLRVQGGRTVSQHDFVDRDEALEAAR